jgi:hypothetical protein
MEREERNDGRLRPESGACLLPLEAAGSWPSLWEAVRRQWLRAGVADLPAEPEAWMAPAGEGVGNVPAGGRPS